MGRVCQCIGSSADSNSLGHLRDWKCFFGECKGAAAEEDQHQDEDSEKKFVMHGCGSLLSFDLVVAEMSLLRFRSRMDEIWKAENARKRMRVKSESTSPRGITRKDHADGFTRRAITCSFPKERND